MTMLSAAPDRRWYFHIPVLGWIARDLTHDFEGHFWYALVIALTLVVLAVMTWGLPALGLIGIGATLVMFTVLILITRG